MLYTSYFANIGKLPENTVTFSIALYSPSWYRGQCFKDLAPTPVLLKEYKETGDEMRFSMQYVSNVLLNLDATEVYNILCSMAQAINPNYKNICLLCYENPKTLCHREFVSMWFRSNGIGCREYSNEEHNE